MGSISTLLSCIHPHGSILTEAPEHWINTWPCYAASQLASVASQNTDTREETAGNGEPSLAKVTASRVLISMSLPRLAEAESPSYSEGSWGNKTVGAAELGEKQPCHWLLGVRN